MLTHPMAGPLIAKRRRPGVLNCHRGTPPSPLSGTEVDASTISHLKFLPLNIGHRYADGNEANVASWLSRSVEFCCGGKILNGTNNMVPVRGDWTIMPLAMIVTTNQLFDPPAV